jgi:hypothetical protein
MPTKSTKPTGKRFVPPISIENAKLIYKNFSGAPKTFNARGLRNFNVVLDIDLAKVLEKDGWNIKWDEPKEEGDQPRARLKVSVRFDNFPPKVWLITKKGKTLLDEETVGLLDDADIETVDLKITASTGVMTDTGNPYVKAYLAKMFVTLSENDLESKYASVSSARHSVDEDAD